MRRGARLPTRTRPGSGRLRLRKNVCQNGAEKPTHYLHEFAFRYNHRVTLGCSDVQRAKKAPKVIEGKRLTYQRPDSANLA